MSIATEISRLQQAKSDIWDAVDYCGIQIPSEVKIDRYHEYIRTIPAQTAGSGNTYYMIPTITTSSNTITVISSNTNRKEVNSVAIWPSNINLSSLVESNSGEVFLFGMMSHTFIGNEEIFSCRIAITAKYENGNVIFYDRTSNCVVSTTGGSANASNNDGKLLVTCNIDDITFPSLTGYGSVSGIG